MDREVQAFLIEKIQAYNPEAKILAEEEGYSELESFEGQVFVIDPIDGTMNFVLEQENFLYYVRRLSRWCWTTWFYL